MYLFCTRNTHLKESLLKDYFKGMLYYLMLFFYTFLSFTWMHFKNYDFSMLLLRNKINFKYKRKKSPPKIIKVPRQFK